MKQMLVGGLVAVLAAFSAQDAVAQACKSLELDELGMVQICIDEVGLSASPGPGVARLFSCPPAWELELTPPVTFSRVRMRLHSAGPYYVKNRLIMKACALEPAYMRSGGLEWRVDRGRCSQWIDLGAMEYIGPRDCYSASERSTD